MNSPEETFVCDDCGRTFPLDQLKEVYEEDHRFRLCPEDLDKRMQRSTEVFGGPGEEKRRAAYIDKPPKEGATGSSVRGENGPSAAGGLAPPRDDQGTPTTGADAKPLTPEAEDAIAIDLETGEKVSPESG